MLENDTEGLVKLLKEGREILIEQDKHILELSVEYLKCWLTLKYIYNQHDIKPTFKPSDKFIKG